MYEVWQCIDLVAIHYSLHWILFVYFGIEENMLCTSKMEHIGPSMTIKCWMYKKVVCFIEVHRSYHETSANA